jgi:hypothetical protein
VIYYNFNIKYKHRCQYRIIFFTTMLYFFNFAGFGGWDDIIPSPAAEGSLIPTGSNASINTMSSQDANSVFSDLPDLVEESYFPDLVDGVDSEFDYLNVEYSNTTSLVDVNSVNSECYFPDLVEATNDFYDIGSMNILSDYLDVSTNHIADFITSVEIEHFLIAGTDILSIEPVTFTLFKICLMAIYH